MKQKQLDAVVENGKSCRSNEPRKHVSNSALDRIFAKRWCQIFSIISVVLLIVCLSVLLGLVWMLFGDSQDVSNISYKSSSSFNISMLQSLSEGMRANDSKADRSLMPNTRYPPPYAGCGGDDSIGALRAIYTDFCEQTVDGRCRLKVGSPGTIEILFQAPRKVSKPLASKCGRLLMGKLALPCMSDVAKTQDACQGFNLPCPLEAGKLYMYRSVDEPRVLPGFRQHQVISEIAVLDDDGGELFCVAIPVLLEA